MQTGKETTAAMKLRAYAHAMGSHVARLRPYVDKLRPYANALQRHAVKAVDAVGSWLHRGLTLPT